jgi:phosphate transport system protein
MFRARLDHTEGELINGLARAGGTLRAVETGALHGDAQLDAIHAGANAIFTDVGAGRQQLLTMLARQSPVAGDLRRVLALVQVCHHTRLIARQLRMIATQLALADQRPARLGAQLAEMARHARVELEIAGRALEHRDAALAEELAGRDRALNRLNRDVFALVHTISERPGVRSAALHLLLVARCLERIGDNAVDVAEQAAFLATGEYREFTDASRPRPPL